jgi:glutathionyl-hydroquinone reductase
MGPEGWHFEGKDGSPPSDPLYGVKTLKELYQKSAPSFAGRVTVPVLWDTETETIVNNESSDIIRMFYTEFEHLIDPELREENRPGGGLYPLDRRAEIDEMNDWVFRDINAGVYKVGFATSQAAYDLHIYPLFAALDRAEAILAGATAAEPFVLGRHLTEADVRLYTTLIRFDVAYVPVFQCTLGTVRHDYPALYRWLRRLYWDRRAWPRRRGAFHETSSPWLGRYAEGYARGRAAKVTKGPVIIPRGPAVLIDDWEDEEEGGERGVERRKVE